MLSLPPLRTWTPTRLGMRLLVTILLASTYLALLATAVQLYLDYARDRREIEATLQQIEHHYLGDLAQSLWALDLPEAQRHLDQLLQLRDLRFAEVRGSAGERLQTGQPVTGRLLERQFPLYARDRQAVALGSLRVEIDMSAVYGRLWARMWVILVTQAAKTFLVALVILALVNRWITRHLHAMAQHARQLSLDTLDRPLQLKRRPRPEPDELDAVVNALNDTSRSLAAEIEQRVDLEQRNRAKNAFLASMNHELRTPLNAILGYAQLLQMDPTLLPAQRRGAETILASGQHLLGLINNVLEQAQLEAGRLVLKPVEVDLHPLLDELAEQTQAQAERKGLDFVADIDADLPARVRVDPGALRRVLQHLLDNAIKFTSQGEVWLRVQGLTRGEGQVRLGFAVQDSGVGIEPAELSRLFHAFERVESAGRSQGGTGLGLALSRQLVRAMGSDIVVDSTPGEGSRFSFELTLPVETPGAPLRA